MCEIGTRRMIAGMFRQCALMCDTAVLGVAVSPIKASHPEQVPSRLNEEFRVSARRDHGWHAIGFSTKARLGLSPPNISTHFVPRSSPFKPQYMIRIQCN